MKDTQANLVILIPHYNNLDGLRLSLLSIQEEFPIDIVIVDDGSDTKPDISDIRKWYTNGEVYLELLPINQGGGPAANHGLKLIKTKNYKYVARLDCGDKCKPGKYKIQLDYLEQNPDVMLLGTWANMVNEKGELLYILKHPTDYESIKRKMFINSRFVHPTVVYRSKILETVPGYKYKYRHAAQDYDFFFEVVKRYKSENLPLALLDYEISPNSISTKKRKLQVRNRIKIILSNFEMKPLLFYSLMRNGILYFLPRNFLEKAKNIISR